MKTAIITEGNIHSGFGHLTRCIALYQTFKEKNITPLFVADCDDKGEMYINSVNPIKLDWIRKFNELKKYIAGYDSLIIDSYQAEKELYFELSGLAKMMVSFDDYQRIEYPPGIIINASFGAEKLDYRGEGYTYLLGPSYIPLRKCFRDLPESMPSEKDNSLLITFGGQDHSGITKIVLNHIISKDTELEVGVILPANLDLSEFKKEYPKINFYQNLNCEEILFCFAEYKYIITAAGQTIYELLRLNKLFLPVGIADNQKNNLQGLMDNKIISEQIWFPAENFIEKFDTEFENLLTQKNRNLNLIDGQGARRIIEYLIKSGVQGN